MWGGFFAGFLGGFKKTTKRTFLGIYPGF